MIGNSFVLGLLSGIMDGLNNFWEEHFEGPLKHLWGAVLELLYGIWSTAAGLIDCIQIIYGMLVGTVSMQWKGDSGLGNMANIQGESMSNTTSTNNMVLDIFLSDYVLGAFWKILLLSIFLLFIFVIIAIIKNEYSTPPDGSGDPKKGETNDKMFVIKRAVRALISFLCVPLACIFGIIATGFLMQALDRATSVTNSTLLSNKMFEICAAQCNRVRTDNDFFIKLTGSDVAGTSDLEDYVVRNGHEKFSEMTGDRESVASLIDNYFVTSQNLPGNVYFETGDKFGNFYENGENMNDDRCFNTKNAHQVFYYYDLGKFQWIIAIASIFWMATIMIKLSLGAAVRLYELAILFIISPAIISMSPLDGGKALGEWQKSFIGKVTMILAPVVAINLYFILVGTLMQVDFTASINLALTGKFAIPNWSGLEWLLQQVYNIMIAIAGLMVCESSMDTLGKLIGSESLMKAGNDLQSKIGNVVTTSAAGKFLIGGGNAVKNRAGNLAAAGLSKVKGAVKENTPGARRKKSLAAHEMMDEHNQAKDKRKAEHDESVSKAKDAAVNAATKEEAMAAGARLVSKGWDKEKRENYQNDVDAKVKANLAAGMSADQALSQATADVNNEYAGGDKETLKDIEASMSLLNYNRNESALNDAYNKNEEAELQKTMDRIKSIKAADISAKQARATRKNLKQIGNERMSAANDAIRENTRFYSFARKGISHHYIGNYIMNYGKAEEDKVRKVTVNKRSFKGANKGTEIIEALNAASKGKKKDDKKDH